MTSLPEHRRRRLSDYLDQRVDDEAPPATVTEQILENLSSCTDYAGVVSRLKLHPKLGPLFYQCLANLEAVEKGEAEAMAETMEDESACMPPLSGGVTCSKFGNRSWVELARFIPLRLSVEERRILALLERTLKVSEYTDNVDIYMNRSSRFETMEREIKKITSVLSGQYIAMKMSKSIEPLTDEWFSAAFEIGRRYKAMNPDRMRETWVKLMYMLQDSRKMNGSLGATAEFQTVSTLLESELGNVDKHDLLSDPLWDRILMGSKCDRPAELALISKFKTTNESEPSIDLIVQSVKDYYALVTQFVNPIDTLLAFLAKFFDPAVVGTNPTSNGVSIAIRSGENGARLNHGHAKQFQYVRQSLKLWREVLFYFMPLWSKAEGDILGHDYRLADTGQGLNRIQGAPAAASLMNSIVAKVQRDLDGNWIGSSVVHLGDHNVPNALMFLDKYSQIPRILGPIAHTLLQLPKEYEKAPAVVRQYIDKTFGSVEDAQRSICHDFFKHGFDGSGADNYYDAGSCIDGRLTSAWNWCSKIEKKSYFPLFLLTNFIGFDGQHGWA